MGRVYVCNGAQLMCNMGTSPSMLVVLPDRRIMLDGQPQANISDFKPMVNILPFGLCQSLANPVVAAATAANFGKLQPMPCIPNTTAPWLNGEMKLLLKNFPALCQDCKLVCAWAGIISINDCGQDRGQGAFPLPKGSADGELLNRLFYKWETNTAEVNGEISLYVKSLDKKRESASFKMIDVETNETLKEFTVQLNNGEGHSETIKIPEDWEARIIKAIEV